MKKNALFSHNLIVWYLYNITVVRGESCLHDRVVYLFVWLLFLFGCTALWFIEAVSCLLGRQYLARIC